MNNHIYVEFMSLGGNVTVKSRSQWDYGIQLIITGLKNTQYVQKEFSNERMTTSIRPPTALIDGTATCEIPNTIFMMPYTIICYVEVIDENSLSTVMHIRIPIITRARPADYICTPEETVQFTDIINTLKNEIVTEKSKATANTRIAYEIGEDDVEVPTMEEFNQLTDEINYLHPLTISGFSVSPGIAEKGSTVSTQTFTYSVNRRGAIVKLEDTIVSGGKATRNDILTDNTFYTLSAKYGNESKEASCKILFVPPIYYGTSQSYALSSENVRTLARKLSIYRDMSFTVNAASGYYILYALPVSLGTPTFKVGGFEGGFVLAGTFDFTNSSGHTESYYLYRSVNSGLGSTTVSVL